MKKIIFYFTMLFIAPSAFSQSQNLQDTSLNCLSLHIQASQDDNGIWIKPNIKLKNCLGKYEILKINRFDQEFVKDCDGKIYIEKLIGGFYVTQVLYKLPGVLYDDSMDVKRTLLEGNNGLEKFKLNDILPIERGRYRIRMSLNFYYNGEIKEAKSELRFYSRKNYKYLGM